MKYSLDIVGDEDLESFLREVNCRFSLILDRGDESDRVLPPLKSLPTQINLSLTEASDKTVELLSSSSLLHKLEKLDLVKTRTTIKGLVTIAKSKTLIALRELRYSVKEMTEEEFRILLKEEDFRFNILFNCADGKGNKFFAPLISLPTLIDLSSTNIGDSVVDIICSSRFVSRLETLDLSNTKVSNKALCSISSSQTLCELVNLLLNGTLISDDGVSELSASKNTTRLKILDLSQTKTSTEGLNMLASSKSFSSLIELRLSGAAIDDAGASALSASKDLTGLEKLDISKTKVTLRGLQALDKSRQLTALKEVKYLGNKIFADEEFATLFGETTSFRLAHGARNGMRERLLDMKILPLEIDLSCTDFGDQGAEVLTKSKLVEKLERLNLTETRATSRGMVLFAHAKELISLKEVKYFLNAMAERDFECLLELDIPFKLLYSAKDCRERELDMRIETTELDLSCTELGDRGVMLMCERNFIRRLEKLDISRTKVTHQGLNTLNLAQNVITLTEVKYAKNQKNFDGKTYRFEVVYKIRDLPKARLYLESIVL